MELVMQYVKYLLEGLAVAAAAYYIPQKKTSLREVAMIALAAAATFAVLDLFAPGVASGARQGAGFGIGANHVGFGEGFDGTEEEGDDEPEVEPFYGSCQREKEGFYGGDKEEEDDGFYGGDHEDEDKVEGFYGDHEDDDETKVEGFYGGDEEREDEGFANTIDNFEDDDDEDDGEDFAVEGFNI